MACMVEGLQVDIETGSVTQVPAMPIVALGERGKDGRFTVQVLDAANKRLLLRGRVCSSDGTPLPQATLDFWQNAANGLYWQVDPGQPSDNLRCQLRVAADGGFAIRTVRPQPYQIPTDGPVWHADNARANAAPAASRINTGLQKGSKS